MVAPSAPSVSLEDLLGGRVLAWAGGIALLAGVVLLFAMATSRGWVGEGLRTLLAAGAALGLGALGVWLQERRAKTEAARAAVASATGILFVTVTVAARVYGLLPAAPAIALVLLVGAGATALALRWESRAIGALGLLGGIAAPLLVDAPSDGATIAVLGAVTLVTTVLCVRRDWAWLSTAALGLAGAQWAAYVLDGPSTWWIVLVLSGFGGLGAIAAAGHDLRACAERLRPSSAWLLCANALTLAAVGASGLESVASGNAADLWLAALAAAHLAAGCAWRRHRDAHAELSLLALAVGVVLADVAFARLTDGVPTTLGWLATAVTLAAIVRRAQATADVQLAEVGLGGHLALGIVQALTTDASPVTSSLGAGGATMLIAIAASCLAAGRLAENRREAWRHALDGIAAAAVAYLMALSLDGPALAAAWAAEAVVIGALWRRTGQRAAAAAALANLTLALGHALLLDAPPQALGVGAADLAGASVAVGAGAAAAAALAHLRLEGPPALGVEPGRIRTLLWGAASVSSLYLLSVVVVTLGDGEQAQTALSATWAIVGVAALMVGLLGDRRLVRRSALSLLGLAAAKVFVVDLAALESLYRVASFLVLGLLLLAGAFAWQRARPVRHHPDR